MEYCSCATPRVIRQAGADDYCATCGKWFDAATYDQRQRQIELAIEAAVRKPRLRRPRTGGKKIKR
jgi:hypothetical protein